MYERIENRGSYSIISTVCDNGEFTQFIQWKDGTRTNYYVTTIFDMGWKSLKEFLQAKPRFKRKEGAK